MSKSLKYQVWCKVRENLRVYKKVKSQVLNKVRDHIAGKVYREVYNQVYFKVNDTVMKDNE